MTDEERTRALESFGYTPRQAQFLVLIALHGGYFLRRQYVAFTGGSHGQAAVRFLAAVQAREHVEVLPYGRQGHVFHLYARPLYAAIKQEHNRNRRRAEWSAVIRKLMTVDFVLGHSQARYWATEEDKTELLTELGLERALWPARRYEATGAGSGSTTRYFVDKMPWYREPGDDRLWFTYVSAEPTLNGFETYLRQYQPLLAGHTSGVMFVSSTAALAPVQRVFDRVICGAPRSEQSALLEYCRLRRDVDANRLQQLSVAQLHRFRELRATFAADRYQEVYQCWCRDGEQALSRFDGTGPPRRCTLRVHRLDWRLYRVGPKALLDVTKRA